MSKQKADSYFGLCPHCHDNDGFINLGRGHWFLCHEHKVMWFIGSNLFGNWRDETEDEQRAIYDAHGVGTYTEINPYRPPPTEEELWQQAEYEERLRQKKEIDCGYGIRFENGVPVALGPDDTPF